MYKHFISLFILIILVTSCFKEDDPMPPFTEKTTTIEMTEYYRYQVYYDLGTDQVVAANDKSDWDLGFECADSSWHILLNTSAFMLAANTGMKDFESVNDTTGLDWKFDKSDGNPDSTAIGSWLEINDTDTMYYNNVYVLDRGLDHVGNYRGLKKIIFTKVDQYGYAFKYANLNGSEENEYYIERDFERNYINFSFEDEGQTIAFEPLLNEWDLLFTMYTTLLYTDDGDPYPYILTGVLTNYSQINIALDSVSGYENIDLSVALSNDFTNKKDAIGYEWKYLEGDPTTGGSFYYAVHDDWTYIIQSRNGVYFKLKFIRFYNDEGDKGYPTFSFQVL